MGYYWSRIDSYNMIFIFEMNIHIKFNVGTNNVHWTLLILKNLKPFKFVQTGIVLLLLLYG